MADTPTHTPGPWKALRGVDDDETRWVVVADGPREYLIATIENGQPGDCLETEGATASLFAAAPDLLAALKNILSVLPDDWAAATLGGVLPAFHLVEADVREAMAAVAKAESQS